MTSLFLFNCGDSNDSTSTNQTIDEIESSSWVNWEKVSSDFNPNIEETKFNTANSQKVELNLFGFSQDVQVLYLKDIPKNTGILKVYTVSDSGFAIARIQPKFRDNTIFLNPYNTSGTTQFSCGINIENQVIQELTGSCYVRAQVLLAPDSLIEIYNQEQLLTKRFIPIEAEEFLESVDNKYSPKEKFDVFNEFIHSYTSIGKKPQLNTDQLTQLIQEFYDPKEKLSVLRRLHKFIVDKESLPTIIESEFNYFDREKAFKIIK